MAKTNGTKAQQVVIIARPPNSNWARVAFGTLVERKPNQDGSFTVTLKDARQALYYDGKTGGEFGLATNGPLGDSRITATVARVTMSGVGLEMAASPTAAEAWTKAPTWSAR